MSTMEAAIEPRRRDDQRPSPRILFVWKIYWVALLMDTAFDFFAEGEIGSYDMHPSPLTMSLLGLALIFALAPFLGHAGYAWQQPIARQVFWRTFFALDAFVWWAGVAYSIFMSALLSNDTASILVLMKPMLQFAFWAPQLYVLWAYAFRSDHLWFAQKLKEGPAR